MRLNKILAGLLMTGAIVSATAHADGVPENTAVGKVDAVYVREARGLFIEKKLLRHSEDKEVWVDVRGAATVAATTTGEMFQVPADLAIRRGDLVATRMGDASGLEFKLIAIPNKVTQLVAPHDSLMAMTFGLPKAPGMVNLFLQAKAY
jgi:hypothetical protein